MCTLSMVHDHFGPLIPGPGDGSGSYPGQPFWPYKPLLTEPADLLALRQLIDDFRQAVEAAKKVDALTKQADCLDPEKAKLQERVDRLEKIIDALLAGKAAPPTSGTEGKQ